ncbi:MAG: DUF5106 domain-containing protein [Bacteroidota bacterium]|nr:DUF5106 domain-containing protein [Bacteroidota bacterium]
MAQKPAPKQDNWAYNIKFTIKGLNKGDTILLANYWADKQLLKDTAIVTDANGNFAFTGKESLPGGIYMVVLPGKQYFEIIISGTEKTFTMETMTTDYTKYMKSTGTLENKAFYDYLKFVVEKGKNAERLKVLMDSSKIEDSTKAIRSRIGNIEKEIFDYRKNFIANNPTLFVSKVFKSMMEPEIPETPKLSNGRPDSTFPYRYYKTHFFDNLDLADDRMIRTPVFQPRVARYFKDMILQIPDSINKEADQVIAKTKNEKGEIYKYIVWYVTNQYETSQIMGMDAVFVHMAENYYLTGKAYWINEETENKIRNRYNILKYVLLGKFAPPLTLPDTSNKNKSFTSIKAKYTVLWFWDPDCGHCQKETPKLRALYDSTKSKYNWEVYAVNTKTEPAPWKTFIKANKLNWINVYDPQHTSGFQTIYDIYSTPTLYLLDESKKIIGKRLGVEQLPDFFINYDRMKNGK